MAHGFGCFSQKFFGQTKTLEPMQQVVSKEEQLEESDIGGPGLSWNFVERQIIEQFAYGSFDVGSLQVIIPNLPRVNLQVGDEHRIAVTPVPEQCQLFNFLRVDRQRSPYGDETAFTAPLFRPMANSATPQPRLISLNPAFSAMA